MHLWNCPCDGSDCARVCSNNQTNPDGTCVSAITCTPVGTCQQVANQFKRGSCPNWPCQPGNGCVSDGCSGTCVFDPMYSVSDEGVQSSEPKVYCDVSSCAQSDCRDSHCICSSSGTPLPVAGDPVDMTRGTSVLWASDFGDSRDNISVGFSRSYVSGQGIPSLPANIESPQGGAGVVPVAYTQAPKPFGSAPANLRTALWTHGLWSYVREDSHYYILKRGNGAELHFTPCENVPCWAGKRSSESAGDKLQRTAQGFVLVTSSGERHIYAAPWAEEDAPVTPSHYFLSRIEASSGKVLADVTYALPPGLSCVQGTVAGSEGVPYLSQVTLPNGVGLRLEYVKLGSSTGYAQCVVRHLYRRATLASGVVHEQLRATYYYEELAGIESAGLLSRVAFSSGEEDTYQYPEGSLLVSRSDVLVAHHSYDSTGRVTAANEADVQLEIGNSNRSACPSGLNCCGTQYTRRRASDVTAHTGRLSAAKSNLVRDYDFVSGVSSGANQTLLRVSESCFNGGCSPGTIRYDWTCGSPGEPPVLKGIQDKRSNWTVFDYAFVTDSSGTVRPEKRTEHKGALHQDGGVALEEANFSYVYDDANQQLPSISERDSLLMPSNGKARRVTRYAPGTSRVTAVLESGWTRIFNSDTGNWSDELRVRGTFYFSARTEGDTTPDPEGRTLEEHGPCWVESESATDCPAGEGYKTVRYHYWQQNAGWPRAGRLSEIRESGPSVAPLATYVDYAFDTTTGEEVSTQTDASGVVRESRSLNGRLVSTRALPGSGATAVVTTYGYDSAGRLTWTRLPEGNYEVTCYRTGTPSAACAGGSMTSKLQWRAKSAVVDGATWSEKVTYSYWEDGTLQHERHLDAAGVVRLVRGYSADAHRRPTMKSWGEPYSVTRGRRYDANDNLAGVGSGTFANCTSGTAICNSMVYDRANRLSRVDDYPTNVVADSHRTCFKHDRHGNITSIESGLTSSTDCETYSPGVGASLYTYDDFGQLVQLESSAMGVGSARGATRFAYDAAGQQIVKQTPSQAAVSPRDFIESTYDALGRLARVARLSPPASMEVLYRQGYEATEMPPASCGVLEFTQGRTRWRDDSFGRTWYGYDWAGRVLREVRVRHGSADCSSSTPHANPHTAYTYSVNGNLTSIIYPYGRAVRYVHGEGAWADRVQEVRVTAFGEDGSASDVTLLSQISWEPYGGLRGYRQHLQGSSSAVSVEYMLGAATKETGRCATETNGDIGANDKTGRIRALWVSTLGSGASWVPGAGNGAVLRQTYDWSADQVKRSISCLLGSSIFTSPVQTFSYDRLLRLTSATGTMDSGGGPFGTRSFGYDGRGNRTSEAGEANSWTLTYGASPAHPDWLTQRTSQQTDSWISHGYGYDSDGRVSQKTWPNDSVGSPVHIIDFAAGAWAHGGNDVVFRSASVNGASYSYYYDAANRRRMKVYPTGAGDEYFYDLGHNLLVDIGNDSLLSPDAHPTDEYVWLANRPVALIRGQLDTNGGRMSDGEVDCRRAGEMASCGMYSLVTDYLGKPALMLDGQGRVVGTGEYDAFGQVNRVNVDVETPHPYGTQTGAFGPTLKQTTPPNTSVQMRVLVDALDLYAPEGPACSGSPTDELQVHDASSGVVFATLGADRSHGWTDWISPGSAGIQLALASAGDCDPVSVGCACTGTAPTAARSQMGVAASAYEYRRLQTGAQPLWTPLRFPGQYHDAETDLFENWNRYYDPSIGRYLQPEPMLQSPRYVRAMAWRGRSVGAYAYALNNPLHFVDRNGLTALRYTVSTGSLYVDPEVPGRHPYVVLSSSGRSPCLNVSSPSCERSADTGAIPRGWYELYPHELSDPSLARDIARRALYGDWGDWRVRLHAMQCSPADAWPSGMVARDGFFLHCGGRPGSAGCIDVGGGILGSALTDQLQADILADPDGVVTLDVEW
ncbi:MULTISPECIES: RHS repeat-associated core domain-containing protein [unclassified Myxococcus]|uniref:RHS repeat-associated core domain-containing protein n=2 Tax=Myxococcaceae TaxID=31 RepID=UPI00114131B0